MLSKDSIKYKGRKRKNLPTKSFQQGDPNTNLWRSHALLNLKILLKDIQDFSPLSVFCLEKKVFNVCVTLLSYLG